jgi:hypothetical protein
MASRREHGFRAEFRHISHAVGGLRKAPATRKDGAIDGTTSGRELFLFFFR